MGGVANYSLDFTQNSVISSCLNQVMPKADSIGHSVPIDENSPREKSVVAVRERTKREKNNTVTIDFKQLKLPIGAETDSNRTPQREILANYHPNNITESARSNTASIVREIEKVTKYTEDEIRESIHISSQEQEIKLRQKIQQQPQTLNIYFKENDCSKDQFYNVDQQTLASKDSTPYQTTRIGGKPTAQLKLKITNPRSWSRQGPNEPQTQGDRTNNASRVVTPLEPIAKMLNSKSPSPKCKPQRQISSLSRAQSPFSTSPNKNSNL